MNTSKLDQKVTFFNLIKFSTPSIFMMVFMSLYTIIDGMFVSRYVGSNALSSINIVFPILNIVMAIATMFATGGTATISKLLGMGEKKEARECMTQFIVIAVSFSLLIMILTILFLTPICTMLGSNEALMEGCQTYLLISILFIPACMLQILYQSYLVTAGNPGLALVLTLIGGFLNVILDYLFIVPLQMGISGAALATGIGQLVPALIGTVFFLLPKHELHFTRFRLNYKELFNACYNGSSEMIGQLSNAVVTFLFNIILIRLVGANGVAAITILLYGQFLFNAFYMGFSMGISPLVGYQYGANNQENILKQYKISFVFVVVSSIVLTVISLYLTEPIVSIFTKEVETFELAVTGFRIFAFNFMFSGFNILSSGFFTSLSNGKVSAIISFSRTLVFIILSLTILPKLLGLNGVWIAIPVAECITFILCMGMHYRHFWRETVTG